jgi:hypothetical protein
MNNKSSDETYMNFIERLERKTQTTCRQNRTESLRIRILKTMTGKEQLVLTTPLLQPCRRISFCK